MSANLRLSKKETARLHDLSSVVLSSDDPESALFELNQNLGKDYKRPFLALTRILNNDFKSVKGIGIWNILSRLPIFGTQPSSNYLMEYSTFAQSQENLRPLVKNNISRMVYFFIIAVVFIRISYFYRIRILPVFSELFTDMGQELPAPTQFLLSPMFWIVAGVACLILFIWGIFLPLALRISLLKMRKLPLYLCLSPTYWACAKTYHRYLWLSHSRIFARAGEEDPLTLSQKAVKFKHSNKDDWALLGTAHRQGCIDTELQRRQTRTLHQLEGRIKNTDNIVSLVMFVILSLLVAMPIFSLYLPMFMLGDVL